MRIAAIIIAFLLLLLFAVSEVLVAIPVAWWLYVALACVFAAGLLHHRPLRQQPRRLFSLFTVCMIMTFLYVVPWSGRSAFLKRLYSIRPGMTINEARDLMAGYMEGTGWPANPFDESHESGGEFKIQGALVFRHSDEPAYNSDWGIVHVKQGRVTHVEFSQD